MWRDAGLGFRKMVPNSPRTQFEKPACEPFLFCFIITDPSLSVQQRSFPPRAAAFPPTGLARQHPAFPGQGAKRREADEKRAISGRLVGRIGKNVTCSLLNGTAYQPARFRPFSSVSLRMPAGIIESLATGKVMRSHGPSRLPRGKAVSSGRSASPTGMSQIWHPHVPERRQGVPY